MCKIAHPSVHECGEDGSIFEADSKYNLIRHND